jgi:tetratricopeptide (TPR) repeat protein
MRSIVGDKHPDTATSHNNVGDAYMCIQDYPNAIKHLQDALTITISTIGYYKEGTLVIFENLSLAYELIEDLEKSIDNQMQAIKISEKLFGRIHSRTQISYQRAGEKLDAYGDWNLALKYLYEAFDIQLNISGDPTFELADLCHAIGSLHCGLKHFEDAERMIENAINILSDVDVQSSFIEKWREHLQIIKERNNVNKE